VKSRAKALLFKGRVARVEYFDISIEPLNPGSEFNLNMFLFARKKRNALLLNEIQPLFEYFPR